MVITFWILAVLMVAVALLVVLFPLLRSTAPAEDETGYRYAAYRAELSELEGDTQSGVMDSADAETARADLSRELLEAEQTEAPGASEPPPGRRWIVSLVIAVLFPAFSLLVYVHLGDPAWLKNESQTTQMHSDVERMVASLRARLEKQPHDRNGWMMLARSYMVLGEYRKAVYAMQRLQQFAGDDPTVLVAYADALSMANGGHIVDKARDMVLKALKEDPHNTSALMLAGTAAAQRDDATTAIAYWKRMLPYLPPQSQMAQRVRGLIAEAGGNAGTNTSTTTSSSTTKTTSAAHASISVHVQLAANLHPDPDATVFIVAKAPNGPSMPLAVVRRKVSDLPLNLTLDDSSAMSPAAKISDYSTVNVSARVSFSGRAMRQPGDFIGEASGVKVADGTPVTITIDKQVP